MKQRDIPTSLVSDDTLTMLKSLLHQGIYSYIVNCNTPHLSKRFAYIFHWYENQYFVVYLCAPISSILAIFLENPTFQFILIACVLNCFELVEHPSHLWLEEISRLTYYKRFSIWGYLRERESIIFVRGQIWPIQQKIYT